MGTSRKGTLMREKEIERALATEVKKRGGLAIKLVTPTLDGMPDRLVLMPNSKVGFVEVKAPGLKPRALQLARHRMLRNLGFQVFVLDDKTQIGGMLDAIQTTWFQIYQVVKENCTTDYGGANPQDDLMERLLSARKGR